MNAEAVHGVGFGFGFDAFMPGLTDPTEPDRGPFAAGFVGDTCPQQNGSTIGIHQLTGYTNTEGWRTLYALVHKKPPFPLTTQDRCDRCSARAVVQTMLLNGGLLLWCGHHFGRNEAALDASAARVVSDERDYEGRQK